MGTHYCGITSTNPCGSINYQDYITTHRLPEANGGPNRPSFLATFANLHNKGCKEQDHDDILIDMNIINHNEKRSLDSCVLSARLFYHYIKPALFA